MAVLDIILALALVWAVIHGAMKGLIGQLALLAGLLVGVWLAMGFNDRLSEWVGMDVNGILAYVILFAGGVLAALLLSFVARKLIKGLGFGFIDRLGGVLLSLVSYTLLLSLLLGIFRTVNTTFDLVEESVLEESVLAEPIERVADAIIPFAAQAKDAILEGVDGGAEQPQESHNVEVETEQI